MKLHWHIVKKDFSRFWLGMLLLSGIVVLKLVLISGVFYAEITRDWTRDMIKYQWLLLGAQWILTFFLAVAIVQEDPVAQPGAFWETLPIGRRQLLGAKLIGAALICIFSPLLTFAIGWLVFGLSFNLFGSPLVAFSEAQVFLCLLAFTFASLAKNMAHLVFWMIGATLILFIPVVFPGPFGGAQGVPAPSLTLSHMLIALLIWVFTGIAITLNQYLGSSRKRSVVFLVTGLIFAVYVGASRFPLNVTAIALPGQHQLDNFIASLKTDVVQANLTKRKDGASATTVIRVSIAGADLHQLIYPYDFYGQLMPISSSLPQTRGKIFTTSDGPLKNAVARALGFDSHSTINSTEFGVESGVPEGDLTHQPGRTIPYAGQIGLYVRTMAIEGKIDLIQGSVLKSVLGETRVTDVTSDSSVINVTIVSRDAATSHEPGWSVDFNAMAVPYTYFVYALVNTKSQIILTPFRTSLGLSAHTYGILLFRGSLQFVLPSPTDGTAKLADWSLVKIKLGSNHRAVKSFAANVHFKETAQVELDPAWLEER